MSDIIKSSDREYFDNRFDKLEGIINGLRSELSKRISAQEDKLHECQLDKERRLPKVEDAIKETRKKPSICTIIASIAAVVAAIISIIALGGCGSGHTDPPTQTVLLTWTAPDDNTGVVDYQVRMGGDTALFYTIWFALDSFPFDATPKEPGQLESLFVEAPEGEWCFNVRAVDAAGNMGMPSNCAVKIIDLTIPDNINDLQVE